MPNSEVLSLDISGQVATITVTREKALNALNADVLQQLEKVISDLSNADYEECRVVVIRGAGEKAFIAGADIKLMQQASRRELTEFISLGQRVMRALEQLGKPVIAVVDGFAIGGGLELALAADLILATDKALLGQAEVNLGLIPGFGGTQRLKHRTGVGPAKRLIFTADNIGGKEALQLGIVDWCVAPEELEDTLKKITDNLLSKGPLALAAAKRAIERGVETSKLAGLTKEVEEFLNLFHYSDTKEGLAAFTEKRKANFKGI